MTASPGGDPFAASEVRAHGGRFAIVCPPGRRPLKIVGASEWMTIHADPESGLAALRL